jgi:hypothetical protein
MASYFVSICDPAKASASNRRPRSLKDICLNYQVTHLGAVVEPAFIRIFARFGLDFEPLGGPVEHHGIRQPCVARLVELIRRSREGATPLWQYMGAMLMFAEWMRVACAKGSPS